MTVENIAPQVKLKTQNFVIDENILNNQNHTRYQTVIVEDPSDNVTLLFDESSSFMDASIVLNEG